MDFEALKKNFEELNEQVAAARKEMQAKSTGFVEAACKQFFDACPEVKSVFWTQYTPYFNDGEACEFSVYDKYFTLFGAEADYDDEEGSVLYTEKDLNQAKERLVEAEKYTADPNTWIENYKKEYHKKYGRDWGSYSQPKPYPSDPEEAKERLEEIESFLEKYPLETTQRIDESFSALQSALNMIDEDIMQAIYGDHVKVTITRAGTDIDEYDHE